MRRREKKITESLCSKVKYKTSLLAASQLDHIQFLFMSDVLTRRVSKSIKLSRCDSSGIFIEYWTKMPIHESTTGL